MVKFKNHYFEFFKTKNLNFLLVDYYISNYQKIEKKKICEKIENNDFLILP